jgi:hypothetical protein
MDAGLSGLKYQAHGDTAPKNSIKPSKHRAENVKHPKFNPILVLGRAILSHRMAYHHALEKKVQGQ